MQLSQSAFSRIHREPVTRECRQGNLFAQSRQRLSDTQGRAASTDLLTPTCRQLDEHHRQSCLAYLQRRDEVCFKVSYNIRTPVVSLPHIDSCSNLRAKKHKPRSTVAISRCVLSASMVRRKQDIMTARAGCERCIPKERGSGLPTANHGGILDRGRDW